MVGQASYLLHDLVIYCSLQRLGLTAFRGDLQDFDELLTSGEELSQFVFCDCA